MTGPYLIKDQKLLNTLPGQDAVVADAGYGVQCVGLVKYYSTCGPTGGWKKGPGVADSPTLARGTAIATFDDDGKYANKKSGNHACFFLEFTGKDGFRVLEQHVRPNPGKIQVRVIRYRDDDYAGSVSDDGNAYSVIL